jgi:hypothetical protein
MMKVHLKCDHDHTSLHIGKVVVSVFPNCPNNGRVTLDFEILRAGCKTIRINTDCQEAKPEELSTIPYDDRYEALEKYLGEEDYGKIDDERHLDSTGGEKHVVMRGRADLQNQSDDNGVTAWRLEMPENHEDLGETVEVEHEESAVEGILMAGDWFRIVRDWPESETQGIVERAGLTVEMNNITCNGLYIWYFAPDNSYKFLSGSKTLSLWKDGDPTGQRRPSIQFPDEDTFEEFSIWKDRVYDRDVLKNFRHISWDTSSLKAQLRAGLTSPELRQRRKRRNFWVGAGIAIFSSGLIQTAVILAGRPDENFSVWWFWGGLIFFAVSLVISLLIAYNLWTD